MTDTATQLKDTHWLRFGFLTETNTVTDASRYRRSSGWLKFTDTTLGGNTAINAPYQFCRYADIKERRLLPNVGKGMGRWYSENIDDWGQNVHFRVGVPAYTGTLNYLLRAVDGPTARYVATGRTPGLLDTLGAVSGMVFSVAFYEFTIFNFIANLLSSALSTRFYYLKPTMFNYWRGVQTICNSISAAMGLTTPPDPRMTPDGGKGENDSARTEPPTNKELNSNKSLLEKVREGMPDTWRSPALGMFNSGADVGMDIHAIASRAQGLQVKWQEEIHKVMEQINNGGGTRSVDDIIKRLENALAGSEVGRGNNVGGLRPKMTNPTLSVYEKNFLGNKAYTASLSDDATGNTIDKLISNKESIAPEARSSGVVSWFKNTVDSFTESLSGNTGLSQMLLAELRDGSQWVSFRIDNATESVNESFSNSSESTNIVDTYNSLSQMSAGFRHELSEGKTGIGIVDGIVDKISGGIMDIASGGISGDGSGVLSLMNPIMGIFYGSKLQNPKRWSSSSSSMPTTTFTLSLKCGYGNEVSMFQDLIVPLAMCLQLALPRGTGPQSYGSPFYVQYYNKGRSQVKIGLVSNLSITRGTGTAPWHKRGWPMGIDISFTIEDMNETMVAPVASFMKLGNGADGLFGGLEDTAMGDYVAVLAALGMNEQEYFKQKFQRKFNNLVAKFNTWTSPYMWTSWAVNDTAIGSLATAFAEQTSVRK